MRHASLQGKEAIAQGHREREERRQSQSQGERRDITLNHKETRRTARREARRGSRYGWSRAEKRDIILGHKERDGGRHHSYMGRRTLNLLGDTRQKWGLVRGMSQ